MPMYELEDATILEMVKIDHERAEELSDRIGALVRRDGRLYEIETPDLFNEAFMWSPKLVAQVDANRLVLITAIRTFHTCGYHMLVKPSVSEVLAQIPEEYINEVQAFEVLLYDPVVRMHTSGKFYGHSMTTLLYRYQD